MAATTSAGGRNGKGMISGINVTPMVDVVLVLLVIMMVSATYIVQQTMKVDLPNTSTSDGSSTSQAAVTITKDRKLLFNKEPVSETALVQRLREAGKKKDTTLIVTADREATHGAVVHVLDLARAEGITSFAVNVERKEK